jgi:hypothetical protein
MPDDPRERIAKAILERHRSIAGSEGTTGYFAGQIQYLRGLEDAARIARETDPWIDVDRHPPEPGQEVLTYSSITGCRLIATWDPANAVFRSEDGDMIPGTRWTPLPEAWY